MDHQVKTNLCNKLAIFHIIQNLDGGAATSVGATTGLILTLATADTVGAAVNTGSTVCALCARLVAGVQQVEATGAITCKSFHVSHLKHLQSLTHPIEALVQSSQPK